MNKTRSSVYLSAVDRYNRDLYEVSIIKPIYDRRLHRCPYCHSDEIIKYGKVGERQRYRCKNCHKTFVSSVDTIYHRGRLGCHVIKRMIDALETGTTLKDVAITNRVNIKTALRYRHLLLDHLHEHERSVKLSGAVQVDETMIVVPGSIKDDGNIRKKGVSRQQSLFAIGVDDSFHIRASHLGRGHPKTSDLKRVWTGIIEEGSSLTHDDMNSYVHAFDDMELKCETWVKSIASDSHERLRLINTACSCLQWFFLRHRGVREKNLDRYLAWFESL